MAVSILSALLAAAMAFAAIRKLAGGEEVVASYARAGVPAGWLKHLAIILLTGAAGLAVGLLWTPLGLAASAATTAYFAVAAGFHVRAGDTANVAMPLLLCGMAAAVLALHAS
jgi:hypothetical protein